MIAPPFWYVTDLRYDLLRYLPVGCAVPHTILRIRLPALYSYGDLRWIYGWLVRTFTRTTLLPRRLVTGYRCVVRFTVVTFIYAFTVTVAVVGAYGWCGLLFHLRLLAVIPGAGRCCVHGLRYVASNTVTHGCWLPGVDPDVVPLAYVDLLRV